MAWCDGSEENRLSLSYYLLFRNSFSALGNRAAPVFSAKVGRSDSFLSGPTGNVDCSEWGR